MNEIRRGVYTEENNKKHTEETRCKMSDAAKGNQAVKRSGGYKMLMSAVIKQAAKDGAAWFFETETGKNYCAAVGVNPNKVIGVRV